MPFIVFDGMDGSGKSTQLATLQQKLTESGKTVRVLHHPEHDGLGRVIRNTLLTDADDDEHIDVSPWAAGFMYAADHAHTLNSLILPALRYDEWVLCHRWVFSTLVYQSMIDGANFNATNMLSKLASTTAFESDADAGELVMNMTTPALSFIFMTDPEEAMARINARATGAEGPYENLESAGSIYRSFQLFDEQTNGKLVCNPQLAGWLGPRLVVDTTYDTIEQTAEKIQAAVTLVTGSIV